MNKFWRTHTQLLLGFFPYISLLSQQMSFTIKQKAHIFLPDICFSPHSARTRALYGYTYMIIYMLHTADCRVTLTATAFLLRQPSPPPGTRVIYN